MKGEEWNMSCVRVLCSYVFEVVRMDQVKMGWREKNSRKSTEMWWCACAIKWNRNINKVFSLPYVRMCILMGIAACWLQLLYERYSTAFTSSSGLTHSLICLYLQRSYKLKHTCITHISFETHAMVFVGELQQMCALFVGPANECSGIQNKQYWISKLKSHTQPNAIKQQQHGKKSWNKRISQQFFYHLFRIAGLCAMHCSLLGGWFWFQLHRNDENHFNINRGKQAKSNRDSEMWKQRQWQYSNAIY